MSSTHRKPTDKDIEAAADYVDDLLAEEDPTPGRAWEKKALGGMSRQQAVASGGQYRYVQIKLNMALAAATANIARDNDISRQGWMRNLIAAETSRITGIPLDTLTEGINNDRPRKARK